VNHPVLPTTLTSPVKRKAATFEDDDLENIAPVFDSPKRNKGQTDTYKSSSHFVLTKAPPSPHEFTMCSPKTTRPIAQPRSPAPKIDTSLSSLSAPAGRSPTRKRIGILNRRRTSTPFTRVDPPKFATANTEAPFSIAAALSGTIPSYAARQQVPTAPTTSLGATEPKASWFFDIHEDTEEEAATNLMEHSTCVLDISSDEESEAKREIRQKENIPPMDDISQSQTRLPRESTRSSRRRKELDEGAIDIDRSPLGDLTAEDFYAEGCTASDVFLVEEEEEEETKPACSFDFTVERSEVDLKGKGKAVEELMMKSDVAVPEKAALFQPLEKAEENFELWESNSEKGCD